MKLSPLPLIPDGCRELRGERIRRLRVTRGMSMRAVAQSMGVSKTCVAHWEGGQSYPSTANLPQLAHRVLGVTIDYLLTGRERAA